MMLKKVILLISLIFLILAPAKALAQTEEAITSFSSEIKINTDSKVEVKEVINYFFNSPKHGIIRKIPYRYKDKTNNKNFRTPLEIISVQDGQEKHLSYNQTNDNNYLSLKIGDPDRTVQGSQTYIISYQVSGVINYFSDYDEFYWNVTGSESDWAVPIGKVEAIVTLPDKASQIKTRCFTGQTGGQVQDCETNPKNPASFQSQKGPLTIVLAWDKGLVAPVERQYEISWRHESPWYWLIPLIILIFLVIKYFRQGRDPAGRDTIVPEFAPPENLKPAEMGTLIDEGADNLDITATIIDLAVKGYLKIRKKDSDYTLIKRKEADEQLGNYEKKLFRDIFGADKEVKVKKIYEKLTNIIEIKDLIYQNLVKKKFFVNNPAKIRRGFLIKGVLIIAISGLFFWFSWHMVFALAFSGFLIIIFAKFMPKKTREGVIAKEKSLGLKEFIYRAERYRVRWQEKENIFEKILPYALIFGIAEIWAKNFKNIYQKPPDWYQGDFATFNSVVFAREISSFSSTAASSFSSPSTSGSSGFGGGGSSGGGFGGGGGGSW